MERLEKFENALGDILNQYSELERELEKLKGDGKTKTARFRELLGEKFVYGMIVNIFKRYGLID